MDNPNTSDPPSWDDVAEYSKGAEEEALSFTDEVNNILGKLSLDDRKRVERRASRQLRQARVTLDKVLSNLNRWEMHESGQLDLEDEIDSECDLVEDERLEGSVEDEEAKRPVNAVLVGIRTIARWWGRLLTSLSDMVSNRYDSLFVETGSFVEQLNSDREEVQKRIDEWVEVAEGRKLLSRGERLCKRLESAKRRRDVTIMQKVAPELAGLVTDLESDYPLALALHSEFSDFALRANKILQECDENTVALIAQQRKESAKLKAAKALQAAEQVQKENQVVMRLLESATERRIEETQKEANEVLKEFPKSFK